MAIGGVSSPLDSFVVAKSFVLRINIGGKNPAFAKRQKRYSAMLGRPTKLKNVMKGLILIFTLLIGLAVNGQTYKLYQTDNIHNQLKLNTKTGEVVQVQSDGQTFLVHEESTPLNDKPNRYVLYKTQNMWTYILLDKFSGKLWQCQYSVKGFEYITSVAINDVALSNTETNKFTIKPMTSMYQYYLIDEETGDMWKFQWSTKGGDYIWIEKM